MRKTVYWIEGDGIGPDVWKSARPVIDEAIRLSYGDERGFDWKELLAGEKALNPEGSPISMSEEHGAVYCEHNFKINDKLRYIPGHCCTTVNIFDELYVVDGDEVVDCWKITARGKAY